MAALAKAFSKLSPAAAHWSRSLAAAPSTPFSGGPSRRDKSSVPVTGKPYTERQDALGRPVSPHVTQYAFPIVALSSITMRICGGMLSVGLGGVAGASLVGADVPALAMACSCFPAKFAVAFPLVYHYAGAVRHTLWDRKPETMLNNKDAEQSSYMLIGSSTAVSVALAACSF
mmetsp:Transcript_10620/g.31660  ORF Transcript_10620/g.31660 Transcript_10620/m.31660 type:complete len:173 (+) Transcript_10620:92-610(+)|eukprot:CAMPEP_0119259942 /NCGR_PEP_ID=MMETSP1329-20130426/557_1 /TAXON_ID=114041 /ORGANISM="Genus nov. species nov., Strain RCC1024" /LENGTH=172 /DNA_ID=CAMNT_0007259351 /DNA_START=59 /DNA_END=577 /DNA_ORIENTATION=+